MPHARFKSLVFVLLYLLAIGAGLILAMSLLLIVLVLLVKLAPKTFISPTSDAEQLTHWAQDLANNFTMQLIVFSPLTVVFLLVVIAVTVLFWTRIHRAPLLKLGLRRHPPSLFVPLAWLLGFAPSAGGLAAGLHKSFTDLSWPDPLTYAGMIAGVILLGVLTSAIMEISFRGYVLQVLEQGWGSLPALIISSLAYSVPSIVSGTPANRTMVIFFLALLLGYAFMTTRSLWISGALSAGWGAGALVVEMPFRLNDSHGRQVLDTYHSTVQASVLELFTLLIIAVLFLLMARRYAEAKLPLTTIRPAPPR